MAVLLTLSAVVLAGCAEEIPEEAPEGPASLEALDLEADEGKGVIRGVVVDTSIVPVAGATVSLTDGRTTESQDDGGFGFGNVEPGFHTLEVDASASTPSASRSKSKRATNCPRSSRSSLRRTSASYPTWNP